MMKRKSICSKKGRRRLQQRKVRPLTLTTAMKTLYPQQTRKRKEKSRDLDSESDDEDTTVRPEKQDVCKPVKPVSRDNSRGSVSRVGKACS